MFKLALFDLDDTCFDHSVEVECYKAVIEYCKTKNIYITMNDIMIAKENAKRKTPHTLNRILYFKNLFNNDLNISLECYDIFWNTFYSSIKPFEGLIETLELFKNNRVKMRICTNFTIEHQIKKCKALNILDYFEDICTSEESLCIKPHERIFKDAIYPYTTEDVCMFGDRKDTDIDGCTSVNIKGFYVNKKNEFNPSYLKNVFSFKNWIEIRDFFSLYFESLHYLIKVSKKVGERHDFTQAGGGNISIKFTYKEFNFIIIKSSGVALNDISIFNGHTLLLSFDESVCWGKKQSIETGMHIICNNKLVVHCHPVSVVSKMCDENNKEVYPMLPYIPPGKELCNEIEGCKNESVILLKNHGIIYQTNDTCIDIVMIELNRFSSFKEYEMCGFISSLLGGTAILSHLSKRFNSLYYKVKNLCKIITTPDVAVFCGEVKENILHATSTSNIFYINFFIYIHSSDLKLCKQVEEIFQFQIMCLEKFYEDGDYDKIPSALLIEEYNKLRNREDEKYRINLK